MPADADGGAGAVGEPGVSVSRVISLGRCQEEDIRSPAEFKDSVRQVSES